MFKKFSKGRRTRQNKLFPTSLLSRSDLRQRRIKIHPKVFRPQKEKKRRKKERRRRAAKSARKSKRTQRKRNFPKSS